MKDFSHRATKIDLDQKITTVLKDIITFPRLTTKRAYVLKQEKLVSVDIFEIIERAEIDVKQKLAIFGVRSMNFTLQALIKPPKNLSLPQSDDKFEDESDTEPCADMSFNDEQDDEEDASRKERIAYLKRIQPEKGRVSTDLRRRFIANKTNSF